MPEHLLMSRRQWVLWCLAAVLASALVGFLGRPRPQPAPVPPAGDLERGVSLWQERRYAEALPFLEPLWEGGSREGALVDALGLSYLQLARIDDGARVYQEALRQPDLPASTVANYHNNFAWALHVQGRNREALPNAQRAVALGPDRFLHHGTLGCIQASLGRLEEARASLDETLRIGDPSRSILQHRAVVLLKLGQIDLARADAAAARNSERWLYDDPKVCPLCREFQALEPKLHP